MRLLSIIVCWLLHASICNAEPILTASTEVPTKGESIASPSVVTAILALEDNDFVHLLNECVQELGLNKKEQHKLFRSVKVKQWLDGKQLFFVRPALVPYCGAFYGAHLFRYWLVTKHKEAGKQKNWVMFSNTGDAFEIMPEETMGYNDIATTGCTGRGCSTTVWKFDGAKYVAFKCTLREFSSESDEMLEKDEDCRK